MTIAEIVTLGIFGIFFVGILLYIGYMSLKGK